MRTIGGARAAAEQPRSGVVGDLPAVRVVRSDGEPPARIVSARVPLVRRLRELWGSRELFAFLVRKDLKVKYNGSVLGMLWSLLNPAVMLLVYDVVFVKFLKSPIPDFALYFFSGLIVWNLFQLSLMGSSSCIVANAGIVKKVAFPREILSLAQVGTATVFFSFQIVVLVLFLAGLRIAPVWHLLPLLPFAIVDLLVFTAALAVFVSAITVYMRDIEHLIVVLLLAWQWGIPMVYSFNFVNEGDHRWIAKLFLADPLCPVVLTIQRVLYGLRHTVSQVPQVTSYAFSGLHDIVSLTTIVNHNNYYAATYPISFYLEMLAWVLGVGIVLFLLAMHIFGRIEGNFAEEL